MRAARRRRGGRARRVVWRVAGFVGVVVALAGVLTACTSSTSGQYEKALPVAPYSTRPNIVFVLTDDLSDNLVRYMPHVVALEHEGMQFSNYTVTDSLCCPSRASIFTGRFPHNTKVFTNDPPTGGFDVFHARGEDRQTFAVSLHNAGYRTAFMGKYLNGFQVPTETFPNQTRDAHYIPPGWSTWDGAGYDYREYGYDLDQDGALHHYGDTPKDYLTNVIGSLGQQYILDSALSRTPFFLELATFSPHSPSVPARQDMGTFNLDAPQGSAFDRHPTDAPPWLAALPPFSAAEIAQMNSHYTRRVESVQSVDRMIGGLERALRRTHQLQNTVFVFSSDNGYHMGEHGLLAGKLTAFDTDIKVPLVVAGPGIAHGSVNPDVVENVDLAPTFEELAGATIPLTVDGQSLVPLLHGQHPTWRTLATVEHRGPDFEPLDPDRQGRLQGNSPSYDAIRSPSFAYVRYLDGQREYYDLATDPDELHNVYRTLPATRVAELNATLDRLITCQGTEQCWAAADPAVG